MMKAGWGTVLARARRVWRATRQRRWLVMGVAWLMSLVGVALVQFVPERLEASSRIYVDTQTVLKPMMVGLTYQPDIDQKVRILARTLISRPNVARLLAANDLGFPVHNEREREALLSRLMDQIRIAAAEGGNLYTISYRDTDPERARRVVEGMVTIFVNSGADGKKQDSEDAGRFIEAQALAMEQKLIEAESRLKEFKVRNFGLTGVSNQDYFARISAMSDEAAKLESDLSAAQRARDAYRQELSTEDPNLPDDPLMARVPGRVPDIDLRIETQRRQIDELVNRYTELNPSVIGARRLLGEMEREKRQLEQARTDAAKQHSPGQAATSPIYQKLRLSLAESEAQVAVLKSRLAAVHERLVKIRADAGRMPQVEAELAQLTRDYAVMRQNYDQLVARRESATLAVKLDESSQLAEFRMIEPPRVSPRPVFPGHVHLTLMACLAAVLAGVAAALIADLAEPTLIDVLSLEKVSGRPVLGAVSLFIDERLLQARRRRLLHFVGATLLLLLFQGAWLAWVASRGPGL